MFCKNCGGPVEEGRTFCGSCGAPVVGETLATGGAAPQGRSSPAPGYAPGWQPPAAPPRRGSGGLVAGIVAAIIIVLAGAGVGVYFGFFRDTGNGAGGGGRAGNPAMSVAAGSTTTAGVTTSAGGQATTTVSVTGTIETIPTFPTTATTGGSVSGDGATGSATTYLTAQDALVQDLMQDDDRIPQLATEINNTVPKVPKAVRDELQSMLDTLDQDDTTLASIQRPGEFDEAFGYLEQAVTHMVNRIQATIQGIEAMWNTGDASSSEPYFDTGRTERDAYRSALQKYHDVLPIE